jgi:hypothetical protein
MVFRRVDQTRLYPPPNWALWAPASQPLFFPLDGLLSVSGAATILNYFSLLVNQQVANPLDFFLQYQRRWILQLKLKRLSILKYINYLNTSIISDRLAQVSSSNWEVNRRLPRAWMLLFPRDLEQKECRPVLKSSFPTEDITQGAYLQRK